MNDRSHQAWRLVVGALLGLSISACGSPVDATSTAVDNPSSAPQTEVAIAPTPSPASTPTTAPTSTSVPTTVPTTAPTATVDHAAHSGMMPTATGETAAPAAPSGETVQAEIKTFQFRPNPLDVPAGTTVTWTNQDAIEHSVTSGTADAPDGTFDSELFNQGGSWSYTFTTPGQYSYFCSRHTSMTGTINVVAP